MNAGPLQSALSSLRADFIDKPVMIWCECLTGGHWHTVQSVKPDDDRVVLVLEPFE